LPGRQLQLRQPEDGVRELPTSGYAEPHEVHSRLRRPGVNLTNILQEAFSYKSVFAAFLLLYFGKRILAQKLLVKCW